MSHSQFLLLPISLSNCFQQKIQVKKGRSKVPGDVTHRHRFTAKPSSTCSAWR